MVAEATNLNGELKMDAYNLEPEKEYYEKNNTGGATDRNMDPVKNLEGPTTVAVIGLVTTALPLILPLIKDLEGSATGSECLIALTNHTSFGIEHHSLSSPRGKHLEISELPVVAPKLTGGGPAPYVFTQSFGISNYNTVGYRAPACLAQWKILCARPIYLLGFVWMARWNNDNAGFFRLYDKPQDLEEFWENAKPGVDYFDCGIIGSKCDRSYGDWGLKLDGSLTNDNPGTFHLVLSEDK